jgi:hypothetical protein
MAVLGLLPLLAGCSSSQPVSRATPSPSVSATPSGGLDTGWVVHADAAGGYAVALPDAWVLVMSDSPTLTEDLGAITAQQADLGAFFGTSLAANKTTGLALLAADPRTVPSGFTSNVTVFRNNLGPSSRAPDLAAITDGKLAALNKDSTITGSIDRRNVRLAGKDASRLAYVFKSGGKSVEVASYLLVVDVGKDRLEYELTIGSAIPDYAALFQKIAASFVLGSPKANGTTPGSGSAPSPAVSLNPNGPGPVSPSP